MYGRFGDLNRLVIYFLAEFILDQKYDPKFDTKKGGIFF